MTESTGDIVMRTVRSPAVVRRCLVIAVVVGTVLNLINQGDVLLAGAEINWIKVVLTYMVPYIVSTYGACSMACIYARKSG